MLTDLIFFLRYDPIMITIANPAKMTSGKRRYKATWLVEPVGVTGPLSVVVAIPIGAWCVVGNGLGGTVVSLGCVVCCCLRVETEGEIAVVTDIVDNSLVMPVVSDVVGSEEFVWLVLCDTFVVSIKDVWYVVVEELIFVTDTTVANGDTVAWLDTWEDWDIIFGAAVGGVVWVNASPRKPANTTDFHSMWFRIPEATYVSVLPSIVAHWLLLSCDYRKSMHCIQVK